MSVKAFAELTDKRIPTPEEFCSFVAELGWRVVVREDGSAVLRGPSRDDAFGIALARMLGREPYRTGVLAEALRRWRDPSPTAAPEPPPAPAPQPEPSAPPPATTYPSDPPGVGPVREWRWANGDEADECSWWPEPGEALPPAGVTHWRYRGEASWRDITPGPEPSEAPMRAFAEAARAEQANLFEVPS